MKHSDPLESDQPVPDPLIQKIKQTLDNDKPDEKLKQQLRYARQLALEQPQQATYSRFLAPVVAFASICAITLAITLSMSPSTNPDDINNIEAFEIITSNDSLEMYENLEFYLWLEDEFKV